MANWPFDAALQAHGATYKPATVTPGQAYWKLIIAEGPRDMGGKHSVFVDVLDSGGRRLVGIPVLFYWSDDDDRKPTESKPGEPYAVDLPIFAANNAYGARVDDGLPSDDLFGMGLVPFEPHVSYRLVFQRTVASGVEVPGEPPTPPVPPSPTLSALQAIEQAQRFLDIAKSQLGG
jgi:hypothetical protein